MTDANHPDVFEMKPSELVECGCDLCQSALRMHEKLNRLIDFAEEREAQIELLETLRAGGP